ncbi:hypothetical protein P8452_47096 [Trifolium repens]|nr:hypothetical protein P8452_47096 [Trifolium repens]
MLSSKLVLKSLLSSFSVETTLFCESHQAEVVESHGFILTLFYVHAAKVTGLFYSYDCWILPSHQTFYHGLSSFGISRIKM